MPHMPSFLLSPVSGSCAPFPVPPMPIAFGGAGSFRRELAVIPSNGVIYSPFSGFVRVADMGRKCVILTSQTFGEATLCLLSPSGKPLPLIDQTAFLLVNERERVGAGQVLASFDLARIRRVEKTPVFFFSVVGKRPLRKAWEGQVLAGGETPLFALLGDSRKNKRENNGARA